MVCLLLHTVQHLFMVTILVLMCTIRMPPNKIFRMWIRQRRSGFAQQMCFATDIGTQMMEAKWCNVISVKTATI